MSDEDRQEIGDCTAHLGAMIAALMALCVEKGLFTVREFEQCLAQEISILDQKRAERDRWPT